MTKQKHSCVKQKQKARENNKSNPSSENFLFYAFNAMTPEQRAEIRAILKTNQ